MDNKLRGGIELIVGLGVLATTPFAGDLMVDYMHTRAGSPYNEVTASCVEIAKYAAQALPVLAGSALSLVGILRYRSGNYETKE